MNTKVEEEVPVIDLTAEQIRELAQRCPNMIVGDREFFPTDNPVALMLKVYYGDLSIETTHYLVSKRGEPFGTLSVFLSSFLQKWSALKPEERAVTLKGVVDQVLGQTKS